jgi:predicted CXXCH cytochrome family protein
MGFRRNLACLLSASCLVASAGAALAAAPARRSFFLSPVPGSRVVGGQVLLSGHLPPDYRQAKFFLNGKPMDGIRRAGTSFHALLNPQPGQQVIEVRDPDVVASLTFAYGPEKDSRPVYTFHKPVQDDDCDQCHPMPGQKPSSIKAKVCFSCHDVWPRKAFVHGPVGAEECVVCHDPHGAVFPHLARYEVRDGCLVCHDQGASRQHVDRAQNRDCVSCHDPHGGKDRFFLKK